MTKPVDLLRDFDGILDESKELLLVAQWLRIIRVPFDAELPQGLDTLPLNELKIAVSNFQDSMRLPDETFNLLRFFLTRKSMLFEAIASKYIKQLKYDVCTHSKMKT
jgi:hypothetical protein